MSYDFWMEDPMGKATPGDSENHTSNTAAMMERAMGIPFRTLAGRTGFEALPPLLDGAVALLDTLDVGAGPRNAKFRQYEAPNGWGTVESTGFFLLRCARQAAKAPHAICKVSA